MSRIDDIRKWQEARANNEASREGFVRLNERQQEVFATQADRLDKFESTAGITINSMARLRVYLKLLDINLGPFFGAAKQRARTAYLTGTRNWHMQYVIDVADVEIKLVGRSVFITIKPADSFYFEFATTGNPVVTEIVSQEGLNVPAYKGCMVGVNVRLSNGVLKTKPTILKQKRSIDMGELSQVQRTAQAQLINEPVVYPFTKEKFGRVRALYTLYEAYGPGHPWSGILRRDVSYPTRTFATNTLHGPGGTFSTRDIGLDIPYQDGEKADPIRTAYIRDSNTDWPRANGKQKVKSDDFGEREFAIYVTAYNEFIVFPVAAIGPINPADVYAQNVPEVYVQRLTPDIPAWGYKPTTKAKDYWASTPDTNKWTVDQPEFEWKFNHLSTKAAAIVFEREEFEFDSTYWAIDANPASNQAFTQTDFDTIIRDWCGSDMNYVEGFGPQTYNPTRYYVAPGIIELTIKIELTGPDLNQYVATLETTEVRRLSTAVSGNNPAQNRWALFVGYVHHDIPKRTNTEVTVKAGTLVAIDLDHYVKPLGSLGFETEHLTLLTCRDVKADVDVFSFVGSPIMAVDLTTLSMVMRLDSYSKETKYSGGATPIDFQIHHFGAVIVHSGVVKEVLLPENIPEEEKVKLAAYASVNGKQYLAALGAGWEYQPPTTARDGYDAGFTTVRDWWAREEHYWYNDRYVLLDPDLSFYGDYVLYKTGTQPTYDNADIKWLNSRAGGWETLLFSTSPRWVWNTYAVEALYYMSVSLFTTFFTHPNGTYAFFDDTWVYDRNGMPGWSSNRLGPGQTGEPIGSDLDWQIDTLDLYDPAKLEHVIFDRVHFEVRPKDQAAKSRNTTFIELYNRAVELGKEAKTLTDDQNLNTIARSDFRATFIKEIGNNTDSEYEFLDLKATYKGREGWIREAAHIRWYGATTYPPQAGTCGNLNSLAFYGFWRTTNYAGGGYGTPLGGSDFTLDPAYWPYRFANPLVIMEK